MIDYLIFTYLTYRLYSLWKNLSPANNVSFYPRHIYEESSFITNVEWKQAKADAEKSIGFDDFDGEVDKNLIKEFGTFYDKKYLHKVPSLTDITGSLKEEVPVYDKLDGTLREDGSKDNLLDEEENFPKFKEKKRRKSKRKKRRSRKKSKSKKKKRGNATDGSPSSGSEVSKPNPSESNTPKIIEPPVQKINAEKAVNQGQTTAVAAQNTVEASQPKHPTGQSTAADYGQPQSDAVAVPAATTSDRTAETGSAASASSASASSTGGVKKKKRRKSRSRKKRRRSRKKQQDVAVPVPGESQPVGEPNAEPTPSLPKNPSVEPKPHPGIAGADIK